MGESVINKSGYVPFIKFTSGTYDNGNAVDNVIKYILRNEARGEDNIYGSVGVFHEDIDGIINDFKKLKVIYHKEHGLQIKHMIVSFNSRPDISRKILLKKIKRTARYWGDKFMVVYAVHEDSGYWHVHFGINSVGYNGAKISINRREMSKMREFILKIWKDCFSDTSDNFLSEIDAYM